MKTLVINLFVLFVALGLFIASRSEVAAQSCTGSVNCCNAVETVPSPSGCKPGICGPFDPPGCVPCTYTEVCTQTQNEGCYFSGGTCGHNACIYYVISGACIYTPPPTPPPPPSCGNGSCGGGESCSTCPQDCGTCPGGGSCGGGSNPQCWSGNNCGEIGKVPGSGSCAGGALCCVDGGGGGPLSCSVAIGSPNPPAGNALLTPLSFGQTDPFTVRITNTNATHNIWRIRVTTSTGYQTVSTVAVGGNYPGSLPRRGFAEKGIELGFGSTVNYNAIAATSCPGGASSCTDVVTARVDMALCDMDSDPNCNPPASGNILNVCTANRTVTVRTVVPWWQIRDADAVSNGDITSLIPISTCVLPGCNPYFIRNGVGGYPGIPIYGGTYDFSDSGSSQGTASSPKNWKANSTYLGKRYDYAYFKSQIPSDVTLTEINGGNANCSGGSCSVTGGFFNSGGVPSRGYVWYHLDGNTLGDLIINNVNLVGSRKVVLLVEGGDLQLTGDIDLQSPGNGFWMAAVGKRGDGSKGNIIVDPSVGGNNDTTPDIEGLYMADGEFRTGTTGAGNDQQLHIRGSIAAWDDILLQRNLGATANQTAPAEYIEYAPELIMTFPRELTRDRLIWREVAP